MKPTAFTPIPEKLGRLQSAFGASLRTPFDFSTGKFAFQKSLYRAEAIEALNSRGNQTATDRLSVYNEQYWYRLLTVLQKDFPLLSATLTPWEFNRLCTEYLDAYPSHHPYLHRLADGFVRFIRETARWNQPRLTQIADLETAHLRAFHLAGLEPLNPVSMSAREREGMVSQPLILQPHLSALREDWNLVEVRRSCQEGGEGFRPEFRMETGYWAVFRMETGIECRKLEPLQFDLLTELASGHSLDSVCGKLSETLDSRGLASASEKIGGWFQLWTSLDWFVKPPNS